MRTRQIPVMMVILMCALAYAKKEPVSITETPLPATPTPVLETQKVTSVVSGDILILEDKRVIKLAGINTYEPFDLGWVDKLNPARRQIADRALNRTTELTIGKTVGLDILSSTPDFLNRIFAYVYLPDGQCLNEVLLEDGLALILQGTPEHPKTRKFERILQQSQQAKLGIWEIDYSSIKITPDTQKSSQEESAGTQAKSASKFTGFVSLFVYSAALVLIVLGGIFSVKVLRSAKKTCPMCYVNVPKREPACQNCGYNFETGYLGDAELQSWMTRNIKVIKKTGKKKQ